jgi:hypothetical protein
MPRYRCPRLSPRLTVSGDDTGGPCGFAFDAEPDAQGIVTCPQCGIWWFADPTTRAALGGGPTMSAARDRAVALLVNYFEAIAKKAGMPWHPDYTVEIGEAVDAMIDPLAQRIAAIEVRLDSADPGTGGWRDRR